MNLPLPPESSAPAVSPHMCLSIHLGSATISVPFCYPKDWQSTGSCPRIPPISCLQTELLVLDIFLNTHYSMAITAKAVNNYYIFDLPVYEQLIQESINH